MGAAARKKQWPWTILRVVVIAQLAYLVIFNAALNLPLTQSLINATKPEKFHVSWDRAWTWYPFRVYARGIAANGQSRSQQWQVETPAAAASIALLPLVLKRVWISDIVVTDAHYKQRPRLKTDKNYEQALPFFPDIAGREITQAVTTPRPDKRPWHLALNDIELSGNHQYWIMQFKGKAAGIFKGDLTFETRGGPFSLSNSQVDMQLDTLYVNDQQEVFKRGDVAGELALTPFVPRDNKGIKMLGFLALDADIDIDVNSLAFINIFTRNFKGMKINGSGQLNGHLQLQQGRILPNTAFSIEADNLLVDVLDHSIEGDGTVVLESDAASNDLMRLAVQYQNLAVVHTGDTDPLLTGENLGLSLSGPATLLADPNKPRKNQNISFTIDALTAPDLGLFEHYLPEKWPFKLHGGKGTVHGIASISTNAMDVDISIDSDNADMGIKNYRFDTNLNAALKLNNRSASTSSTSIGGTYIKLTEAHLLRDGVKDTKPWNASFTVVDGKLSLLGADAKQQNDRLVDLLQQLGQSEGKELLGNLRGSMTFQSNISSLAWIGIFLNEEYSTGVSGAGDIRGVVNLAAGLPAPGTDIEIVSESLGVEVLDYSSHGKGKIIMRVDKGDIKPDWFLEIALRDADLKRRNDNAAYIQNVDLSLLALIEDIDLEKTGNKLSLGLKLLSATVTDMSIFSSYLPPDSPFQLTSGTASLSAEVLLQPHNAEGWVKLESSGLEMLADQQAIKGDLAADIKLVDGVPSDMMFDISGSEINLTKLQVIGERERFDSDHWSARFLLLKGQTTWKKPLQLNAEAAISIDDSRPIVAMFNNSGRKPEWLLNMLTIEDIEGTAKIDVANEQLVIPLAHAISDNIEVGAKASISEKRRDGVIYARYKKLDAIIKITQGNKNTDVIKAREKYDNYRVTP